MSADGNPQPTEFGNAVRSTLFALGFQVLRIKARTKQPIGLAWQKAERSPAECAALVTTAFAAGENWGWTPAPGYVWVDIDSPEAEARLRREHPWLFTGILIRTANGGLHIPVWVGEDALPKSVRQINAKSGRWSAILGPGVDTRLPRKGQVVGPDSVVRKRDGSDGAYAVEQVGDVVRCPDEHRFVFAVPVSKTEMERRERAERVAEKKAKKVRSLYDTLRDEIWGHQKKHRLSEDALRDWAGERQTLLIEHAEGLNLYLGDVEAGRGAPYEGKKFDDLVRGAFEAWPREEGSAEVEIGKLLLEFQRVDRLTASRLLKRRLGDSTQRLDGALVHWTGSEWDYLNAARLRNDVNGLVEQMWTQAGNSAKSLFGELPRQAMESWLDANEAAQLERTPAPTGDRHRRAPFDNQPLVLGLPGSKVLDFTDWRDAVVRDEERDDLVLTRLPVAPVEGETPMWDKFKNKVSCGDAAWAERLETILASGLIREQWHKLFLWVGEEGGNGKGTTVEIVSMLFGESLVKQMSHEWKKGSDAHPQIAKQLKGKGLAFYEEATDSDTDFWKTAWMKDASGGGYMTGRGMKKEDDPAFEKTHTNVLLMNRLPQMRETDGGMKRRIEIMRWDYRPEDSEKVHRLAHKIVEQEGAAILYRLIQRAIELRRQSGSPTGNYPDEPPQSIADSTAAAWLGMNRIAQWLVSFREHVAGFKPEPPLTMNKAEMRANGLAHRFGHDRSEWTAAAVVARRFAASSLYDDYRGWMREEHGSTAAYLGKQKFYERLTREPGVESVNYHKQRHFIIKDV